MTDATIPLSEDELDERYTFVPNHLNRDAGWAYGDGPGCLFETYGEELEFVRRQDPATVWTFVDGDDGDQHVISGFHIVNRIGYLISKEPVPDGTLIEVHIPGSGDDESAPNETADDPPLDSLSRIARDLLRIPTLETRRSDSLDFHDVAVWAIKAALQAAFEAGARSARPQIEADKTLPEPFDAYEIHGVRTFNDGNGRYCEQVPDEEAESWSLFGHIPGQGLDCIGDFATREHAKEVYARITGRSFGSSNSTAMDGES